MLQRKRLNEWQDLEKLLKQAVEPHLFLPHSLFACGILDPITDAGGNVIREAPLAPWANFRQRALDTAIREINAQTDLHIQLESLERSRCGRVSALTFGIKPQAVANDDSSPAQTL